jgi:outer membrane receptor for monomeric catechols
LESKDDIEIFVLYYIPQKDKIPDIGVPLENINWRKNDKIHEIGVPLKDFFPGN